MILSSGWSLLGTSTNDVKNDTYEQDFVYVGGSGNKFIMLLQRFKTNEIAHQNYLTLKSEDADTQEVSVGDEGYTFAKTKNRVILFRQNNVVVLLNMISYPPVKTSDLLPLAKIIDNRLTS